MIETITIRDGELLRGGDRFTLTNPDGNKVPCFNFIGNGTIEGDKLRIEVSSSELRDYIIAGVTLETSAYYSGVLAAQRQKERARKPTIPARFASVDYMYIAGWRDTWRERGKKL